MIHCRISVAGLHVCVSTKNMSCLLFIFLCLMVEVRNSLRQILAMWDSFMVNDLLKFLIYVLYSLKT